MKFLVTCILIIFIKNKESAGLQAIVNDEYRLKEDLFKKYNPDVRPTIDSHAKLELSFDMAIQQIIGVNEKEESLVLSVFLRQFWNDELIRWKPEDYGNLTRINTKPENLWLPDLTLYNNAEKDDNFGGSIDQMTNRLIVHHTGNVEWLSPAIVTSKCPMNIRYFPFDEQKCTLKFGSWTYHGDQVDLKNSKTSVDLSSFAINSEWNIVDANFKRNVVKYGCCPEPYPDVTVHVTVKRKPLFYVLNLLLPMIFIGILTLLSFFLPADSGERISFAVTLMLALTVFMLIVADMIPASSETVPMLGMFFTAVMIQMVLMVFAMSYTLNLHLKSPEECHRIRGWTRKIIYDNLAFRLGVREDKNKKSRVGTELKAVNGYTNGHANKAYGHIGNGGSTNNLGHDQNGIQHLEMIESTTDKLMKENIEMAKEKLKEEELEKIIKREFEICARTFDVLALIVFGFMFALILMIYLLSTGA